MKPTEYDKLVDELERWMDRNAKTTVDVASATHSSPRAIERFLKRETQPRRLLAEAIHQLVHAPASGAV